MADFPKFHGLRIAKNGYIENLVSEKLTTAQEAALVLTSADLGRMWYNTDLKQYRAVNDNGSGGFEIISLIGSASGNAGITVEDEGVQVAEGVETLNFIGADIRAMDGGARKVNIYCPPPKYPNVFNSAAAPDEGFISNTVPLWTTDVTTRTISSPTTEGDPFYTNGWAGTSQPRIPSTRKTFTFTTPGTANTLFSTTTSDITAEVLGGAATATVFATNTLSDIAGNATNTTNGIGITVSSWSPQFDKYKATVSVSFDITALMAAGQPLENGGRFRLKITHADAGGPYTFQQDFFLDTGIISSFNATTGAVAIAEATPVIKSISGVDYYAAASTFNVNVTDIDNLNSNSYTDPLLTLDMTQYGLSTVNVNRADTTWTGLNTTWNNAGADFANTYTFNNTTFRRLTTGATITATAKGNGGTSTKTSPAVNVLIDGYGTTSTRYAEEFNNEAERLVNNGASAPTTGWDSSAGISATDLFIQNGYLRRIPTVNYSTGWFPNSNHVSYTANTQSQVYIREFRTNNIERVNGLIEIGGNGVSESALTSEQVIIEVSTNGTTWGKVNTSSDYRIDSAIYNLNQTGAYKRIRFGLGNVNGNPELGGVAATTGMGTYGMFVRITIPNGSPVELDYFRITDWA